MIGDFGIRKLGRALAGRPLVIEGKMVRLVITDRPVIDICACCVFDNQCSQETCDFCCKCDCHPESSCYFQECDI